MECLSMRGYHKEMTRDTEKLPTSSKKHSEACGTVSIGNGDAVEKLSQNVTIRSLLCKKSLAYPTRISE